MTVEMLPEDEILDCLFDLLHGRPDLSPAAPAPSSLSCRRADSWSSFLEHESRSSDSTCLTKRPSASSVPGGCVKRMRYRKPRPRVSPFPRILKRDIRRDYPAMYANVLNTAERSHIEAFLRTFCVPSCAMEDFYLHQTSLERIPVVKLFSVDRIVNRLSTEIEEAPDFVLRLLKAEIFRHIQEPGSKVVMDVRIQSDNSDQDMVHYVDETTQISHIVPRFIYENMSESDRRETKVIESFRSTYDCNMPGKIVLHLDGINRINYMEFVGTVTQQRLRLKSV